MCVNFDATAHHAPDGIVGVVSQLCRAAHPLAAVFSSCTSASGRDCDCLFAARFLAHFPAHRDPVKMRRVVLPSLFAGIFRGLESTLPP
jgi:hypothetical protein